MAREEQEQTDAISRDSLPRWLRDFLDYNDELAGRETGRAKRFLISDPERGPEADKKNEQRRFDALLRLLQNPEYAKLYQEATDTIRHADDAVEHALERLEREGGIAAERIAALKEKAAELPDGRRVFRSKDDRLIAEDGTDVTAQQNIITGLSSETPAWEEFQRARETLADIQRRKDEIETYKRDVLDPARLRLSDTENPPTQAELREIIERMKRTMPRDVRADFEQDMKPNNAELSVADEQIGPARLGPDMRGQFKTASNVIPGDAFAGAAPGVGAKPA